jgi:hypothetical protein
MFSKDEAHRGPDDHLKGDIICQYLSAILAPRLVKKAKLERKPIGGRSAGS